MERKWRQCTSKRNVTGNQFSAGVIDFDFSVGSNTVFIPSKSYFKIGVSLRRDDGTPLSYVDDDVTFANFCPGNLFDNIFFYAGGQNVSSCVNYSPQAHALSYRLKKSGAWLNSIGKDAYGICASSLKRKEMSSGDNGLIDTVASVPSHDGHGAGEKYFIYQPPIGIMEHTKGMGAGNYRFQFNPATNYRNACREGNAANTSVFEVLTMELYVCEEKMDISPSGTDTLHLLEHHVQSKKFANQLDFTVPPSTKSVSVFIQSGTAGLNPLIPPSRFVTDNGADRTITHLQMTYANTTKPPTNWGNPTFVENRVNTLQQRYFDTQIESGQAFSSGGAESLSDWILNGAVYHYSFNRDSSDRSSQLQLQLNYSGTILANDNVFLVSHFTRSIEIETEAGYISNVTSINI